VAAQGIVKAPDIVESWKWKPAEQIIERLLSLSSRTIGKSTNEPMAKRPRDRYSLQYMLMRRLIVRRKTKQAMRGKC
jgi:hypothetical protein